VFPWSYDPLLAAGSENLNREQLTALEEAHLIARYVEAGEPDSGIARLFRRSQTWVRERREMLEWPENLQAAIHAGTLTIGVARALADVDHADYQQSLIDEAARTGATARVVEVWRAHYLADRTRIVGNHLAVAEIASRREAWRITIACDLCEEQHEYPDTRGLRVCEPCLAAVLELVEQAGAAASRP
jgi:ParB-like chromosome segregation protein Spo0J